MKLILIYWQGSNLVIFTFAQALLYYFKKIKLLKIHPGWSLSCDSSNSEYVTVQRMHMNLVVFRRWEHFWFLAGAWSVICYHCNHSPSSSCHFGIKRGFGVWQAQFPY